MIGQSGRQVAVAAQSSALASGPQLPVLVRQAAGCQDRDLPFGVPQLQVKQTPRRKIRVLRVVPGVGPDLPITVVEDGTALARIVRRRRMIGERVVQVEHRSASKLKMKVNFN